MNRLSNFWFLLRYGVVGVCGGVLQTATLYVWVDFLHLQSSYLLGTVVGFCLALAATFTLQKYWTFKDYARTHMHRQFFWYTSIALVNLGLNVLLLRVSEFALEALGLSFFHLWYLLAEAAIIILLAVLSYFANYFITFHTPYE